MATFHMAVSTIRRAAGQSAVAAAAYRGACRLFDERTGIVSDFRRKRGHVAEGMAGWSGSREALWNMAEAAERRKNAVVAREVTVALPCELDDAGRCRLLARFAEELHHRHGIAIGWDVHRADRRGDARNWHGHLMLTTRRLGEDGRFLEKTRELDQTPSSAEHIDAWRSAWAEAVNRELADAGIVAKVDSRSLKARAEAGEASRKPMEKMGPAATAMERRGIQTNKGRRNSLTLQRNRAIVRLHGRALQLSHAIAELKVDRAVNEVRAASERRPLPAPQRASAYRAMFDAARAAWGPAWPRSLSGAVARLWPKGLRPVASVTARLVAACLVEIPPDDAEEFRCCLEALLAIQRPSVRVLVR